MACAPARGAALRECAAAERPVSSCRARALLEACHVQADESTRVSSCSCATFRFETAGLL